MFSGIPTIISGGVAGGAFVLCGVFFVWGVVKYKKLRQRRSRRLNLTTEEEDEEAGEHEIIYMQNPSYSTKETHV